MASNKKIGNRLSNKICPDGMTIEEWQIALRRENAREAGFKVEHLDENRIWGDYLVSSSSGRYRTAFRGVYSERNFCSCLDFRTNGLGTCKHIEAVTLYLQEHVPGYPWAGFTFTPPYSSIYVSYKGGRSIRMRLGGQYTSEYLKLLQQYFTAEGVLPQESYLLLPKIAEQAQAISNSFRIYEDVYEFANEVTQKELWRADLKETYQQQRIPWDRYTPNNNLALLEELLYSLCYIGEGLIVTPSSAQLKHLLARLIEEIYQGMEHIHPSYIIVGEEQELTEWQQIFRGYSELSELPIEIKTREQFVALSSEEISQVGVLYIDQSGELKNWQNSVSLAIKRLKIDHLYMHLESIEELTPVQLSSILQHISPFAIGPFYQFIHQYRPLFPLKNDGSNLPEKTRELIFPCPHLEQLLPLEQSYSTLGEGFTPPLDAPHSSEQLVENLLTSILEVAQNPHALDLLSQFLEDVRKRSSNSSKI